MCSVLYVGDWVENMDILLFKQRQRGTISCVKPVEFGFAALYVLHPAFFSGILSSPHQISYFPGFQLNIPIGFQCKMCFGGILEGRGKLGGCMWQSHILYKVGG